MARQAAWWIGVAGVVVLFLAVSVQRIWAGDFWGQLATGQWILEQWRVPRQDAWTFTRAGAEVREVRWLYCVAIALGWKVGAWALSVGQAVVLGGMWLVLWRRGGGWAALAIVALGMAAGAGRWVMRPEIATFLLLAVFLVLGQNGKLANEQTGKVEPGRRIRWWWVVGLVLMQVVWVNTHSLYVFGPVVVVAFLGEAVLRHIATFAQRHVSTFDSRTRIVKLGVLFVGVCAACFVNPYGVRGAVYAFEMWREARGVVGDSLGEMISPLAMGAWTWDLWAAAVFAVVVAGTFALNWRTCGVARVVLFAMTVYLAATAQRNVALMAVVGTWAGVLNVVEAGAVWPRALGWGRLAGVMSAAIGLGSAGLGWYVATDRAAIAVGAPKEVGLGVVEWDVPRGAADFVVASGAPVKVFNSMREGHSLTWRSAGRIKVFIDGRTDVAGDALMRNYSAAGPATWSATVDKWGIGTAVLPVRGFEDLVAYLAGNKGWALVYLDHRNVVFVRDSQETAGLIAAHRIDPSALWSPRSPEPSQEVEPWKRAIGGPGRPWYTLGMAGTFLALGGWENAAVYLRRTLAEFPESERARAELAAVERFHGRNDEAERLTRGLDDAWVLASERLLMDMLARSGRASEVGPVLERAVRGAGKKDVSLRVMLGDAYFQAGKFAEAAAEYVAAADLGHDVAQEWVKLGGARERTGDVAGAIEAYRSGLRKDPSNYQVWNRVGTLLGQRGDKAGAIGAFEGALRAKPDFEPAKRNLEAAKRM